MQRAVRASRCMLVMPWSVCELSVILIAEVCQRGALPSLVVSFTHRTRRRGRPVGNMADGKKPTPDSQRVTECFFWTVDLVACFKQLGCCTGVYCVCCCSAGCTVPIDSDAAGDTRRPSAAIKRSQKSHSGAAPLTAIGIACVVLLFFPVVLTASWPFV